jgi:hypothetical protein
LFRKSAKEPFRDVDRVSWVDGGLLIVGTFALVFGLGFTVYARATALSRGLIIWESNVHEFGEVRQSESLTHDFTLENTCSFPVEVVSTSTNCACTTVKDLEGVQINPGDTLNIPVTLNTKGSEDHLWAVPIVLQHSY